MRFTHPGPGEFIRASNVDIPLVTPLRHGRFGLVIVLNFAPAPRSHDAELQRYPTERNAFAGHYAHRDQWRSAFQCWSVEPPLMVPKQRGTIGAKMQNIGDTSGGSVAFFNENEDTGAGLHNAPVPQ